MLVTAADHRDVEKSQSPGRRSHAVSPITAETGHTGLNESAAFSSLPIFGVSRSGPWITLQCP
jgi:hypothetical protein